MESPLYRQRDTEELGDFYIRHVRAMTTEGLHDKSKIAAELAWRDFELSVGNDALVEVCRQNKTLQAIVAADSAARDELRTQAMAVQSEVAQLAKIASWAQAMLSALNAGDVKRESLLHKKLREVMIAFRESKGGA